MTSSLPTFAPAPAAAAAASPNSPGFAGFDATASPASTGDFADLMSEQDAAADCPDMATAMPSFTILAPTLISLLSAPAEESVEVAPLSGIVAPGEAAPTTGGITRDIMEQAASLFATILQSILPEAAPPVVQTGFANTPTAPARSDAGPPVGQIVEGTRPCVPGSTNGTAPADAAPASETAATAWNFEARLAADGAVEIKATLPKEQGRSGEPAASEAGAFEIDAEIILPGQAVMRLSAANSTGDESQAKAKFAATVSAHAAAPNSPNGASERNFLSDGNKDVTVALPESGIAVAKPAHTMTTPTEETRASSTSDVMSGGSSHGQFTVAWPAASRAEEALVAPVERNFAERAVATVSNLVDTQFTASMQKSGSVQLRLKCGGEDVNVRVELRGGEVHTDFRTDSPELRAALNREWQAVASQSSESLRRFVEPVFSPSSSSGGDNFSSRQQAAQQDLSQQSRHPRAHEDQTTTYPRRSFGAEFLSPQPVTPRAPAYVSTSLRLSVLA